MLFVETWQINEAVYNVQSWALRSQFISSSGSRPLTPDLQSVGADTALLSPPLSVSPASVDTRSQMCVKQRQLRDSSGVKSEMDNVNI